MKTIYFNKPRNTVNFYDYIKQVAEHNDELTGINTYLSYHGIKPNTEFLEDIIIMSLPDKHADMIIKKFDKCKIFEDDKNEEFYEDFCEFNNEDFYDDDIDDFEELVNIFEY